VLQRIVGIDLGTTNSALAWTDDRGAVRLFPVLQLVATGESDRHPTLPSFVYLPTEGERESGSVRLPWNAAPDAVTGILARDHGALTPARQIASAKSWLSNALVDRTAALLPWTADAGAKLSPVDASARILGHLRDAWNHEHTGGDALEAHAIVLTVPASFDEEARELTVDAARRAGLDSLTLLEEPLAALYAWIAGHRRAIPETFGDGGLILVCDVGGGTTDFSLIRAAPAGGELAFERIAIGEHLLLGGDNVDLALAVLVEQKLGGSGKLTLTQRETLRRKCSAAKERLLGEAIDRVPITLLGAGRGVVAGGLTADLTRAEVEHTLGEGFLPLSAPTDVPARDRRAGLRELGLPYETEPAITKHLAAFLTRAARTAGGDLARPDFVLFNGGFFKPSLARERVLDCLGAWFGERPRVLDTEAPDAAVALGAAFYGRLRRSPEASRRLLIRAGSARAYYIGVAADGGSGGRPAAVCVMPRGTQEGTRFELDREFTVTSNQPAQFTLFSATDRDDPLNAVVTFDEVDVQRHAPLVTALRYGKRSRRVPLPVRLTALFTETGTLELWCESRPTDHRWRLAFNLRAIEADPLDEAPATEEADGSGTPAVIIADESLERAAQLIREVFAEDASRAPDALTGDLENVLGHGKHAWPLEAIRRLADVFLDVAGGRTRSSGHEARWLNLAGFCTRPGFGSTLDTWRVGELRKVYAAGLTFGKDVQCQVEWLVLWQRVSAGFTAGQQRELAQRVAGQLGIGQRKPPRINAQIDRESWRLLAGLERLDAGQRTKLGGELLDRIAREPRNAAWLWAIARFGARNPLYGPLSSVVPPASAERWIERLLVLKQITPDVAVAIAQIGARTGDPARDISADAAQAAIKRLEQSGVDRSAIEPLRSVQPATRADAGRVFGESLPEGLRLKMEAGQGQP
jgi:molecular chaperone DnaK (HSP70)